MVALDRFYPFPSRIHQQPIITPTAFATPTVNATLSELATSNLGTTMNQKRAFELMIMRFIDAYVDLHGEINTTTIINQFPIHRTKASRIVQLYLKPKPSNLRYVPSKSCYLKGFSFEKLHLKDESSLTYLNAMELAFLPYTEFLKEAAAQEAKEADKAKSK